MLCADICFIASAAFLWGVSAALGRAVFTGKLHLSGEALHPIDPLILSQTRTSFSLLVLLPLLVGRRGWQRIKLPKPDLIQCLVIRHARRGRVELFLLCRDSENQRGYRDHRAIHRAGLGAALRSCPRTTKTLAAKSCRRWSGHRRHCVDHRHRRREVGVAVASRPYGFFAALVASFSFAFYNVGGHRILARTTAGASWSGRWFPLRCSGCS